MEYKELYENIKQSGFHKVSYRYRELCCAESLSGYRRFYTLRTWYSTILAGNNLPHTNHMNFTYITTFPSLRNTWILNFMQLGVIWTLEKWKSHGSWSQLSFSRSLIVLKGLSPSEQFTSTWWPCVVGSMDGRILNSLPKGGSSCCIFSSQKTKYSITHIFYPNSWGLIWTRRKNHLRESNHNFACLPTYQMVFVLAVNS